MSIHDFLERLHAGSLIGRFNGLVDLGLVGWSQGLAQDIEGFDDPQDLSGEKFLVPAVRLRGIVQGKSGRLKTHSTLVNHCIARAAFRERVRFSCIVDRR